MADPERCVACGLTESLSRVVTSDGAIWVCETHRSMPESSIPISSASPQRRGADRRHGERRMFPRPERRRHNDGRRADDVDV